ncbi:DUF4286 family protein [Sphingobacteriaceae bacterium WQ 2009]|uniref:DUF4286 family protein n=1 Tax=Rhinopithecimicrobium faecis TaxID=2820698 RepID=A0A8T4HAJ4_9SPHI|nr:DUF4286 family protein [Sphingobacteriaceae bacterium WQ 2009]
MYLYNISIIAEDAVHQHIAAWLQENIVGSGRFETRFLELLESPHEGVTYCIQLNAADEQSLQDFQDEKLPEIQALLSQPAYYGKVFMFDSKMKYIL